MKMRAAVCSGIEEVEIHEIEKPVITETEVLIKTKNVGVCGSDLHLYRGTHPFRHAPAILGHEIAGEIVEVGSKVTKFKVGDRVTVEPQVGCGECEMCKVGAVSLCKNKNVPGTPGWIGTFSEYFNAEESVLYKLEDGISYERGTLTEPLAVAVQVLHRAETKQGSLVILGGGTIGQLLLAVAKKRGFGPIIVTDTVAFNREFALAHGADYAFDPIHDNVEEEVKKITEGGADLVVVAAGANNILDQACNCARKRGEVGIVAMITKEIPFYSYAEVFNELRMFGAMCYEREAFRIAAELINDKSFPLDDYVTQVVDGIENTKEGLDILSQKKENTVKVEIKISK